MKTMAMAVTQAGLFLGLALILSAWVVRNRFTVGTKSILFGVHCFFLHPFVVALAWMKLYGARSVSVGHRMVTMKARSRYLNGPIRVRGAEEVTVSIWSPRLWLAFFVHDLGYFGSPNMDGPEGELHPLVGARIMDAICGEPWGDFVKYHSRFLAKKDGAKPSPLCMADKLAIVLPPRWIYLILGGLTGEIDEYMARSDRNNATGSKYAHMHPTLGDRKQWHDDMCAYVRRWVEEHKDGRADTWTPAPDVELVSIDLPPRSRSVLRDPAGEY